MTPATDELRAARHLAGPEAERLLAAASAAAGAELTRVHLRSVHHRARRSVSHVYEATLVVDGQAREVLLVAHVDAKPLPAGTFTLRADDDEDEVAVWRFPHDPFLPGLPSAVHRVRVRELLDELGAPGGEVTLRTRAYRPSRRAVVEVTIDGTDAAGRILYLKILAGDRAAELAGMHRQLAPVVPVPRVVGVAPQQGILAIEALAGDTLRDAMVLGRPLPPADEVADLSRRFASAELTSRRDPRAFADPTRHVALLSRLVPEDAATIARVAAAAAAIDGPLVPVHGDLHDAQVLLTDGAVTGLLDIDGAGPGLVAEDAGNLVAHLEVLADLHPQVGDRALGYAGEVADAYRQEVGAHALRRATAGAWLALATGPHRAQDERWREATRQRIARAARTLAG
jgi:aminoglycoside phosphotransferase (APT) family kinase protein